MKKDEIKVLITGEHMLGDIVVARLSGTALFPNHVYDLVPYPWPDGGNDFKVFKRNTSISRRDGCKITDRNILINITGEGFETVITVSLTNVDVNLLEQTESWVDVSIKGCYGLKIEKRVCFYKVIGEIKLLENKVFNDEKEPIAEFIYKLPASYFSNEDRMRCHVGLGYNSLFTFKNAENKEDLTSFDLTLKRDIPAIEGKIFLVEKENAPKDEQEISITISYIVSEHPVKVKLSSEKIQITERPEGCLKIVLHKTSESFILGEGQVTIGELIVKNEGDANAKSLNLIISQQTDSILHFSSYRGLVFPSKEKTIKLSLKEDAIKLLPFSWSETVDFFDGTSYLQKKSFSLFSMGQPQPEADYLFEFAGQDLISLEASNADFYPGDKDIFIYLTVKAKKDINKLVLKIIQGMSFAKLEIDCISSLECNQECTIPVIVCCKELKDESQIIITAKSEYSSITKIDIPLKKRQRKEPNPVIEDIHNQATNYYIGGHKKTFSKFTLHNDLPGLTTREGVPINLSEIGFKDKNGESISWLSLTSNLSFIDPGDSENIEVFFNPEAIDKAYAGEVYFGVGNKSLSIGKICVEKREKEKEPRFIFTNEKVMFIPDQNLIIGTLKIEKKRIEETDDGIILREEEKVVITDEASFYFLKKDGDDEQYVSVPIESDSTELLIVKKTEACGNEDIKHVIPVVYSCKGQMDRQFVGNCYCYSIRKNTPDAELQLTICSSSKDSFIVPLDKSVQEHITITVIKQENPDIAYIPLLTLCFDNLTKISHDDINNRITITELEVAGSESKKNKLIENRNFEIFNGASCEEIIVQVAADANIPKELSVTFRWKGKKFFFKIDINIIEEINDGWVSLDLGTSGIVMAQYNKHSKPSISKVSLDYGAPEEYRMETEQGIISSAIILQKENEQYKLQLCPSRVDFKKSDFHFVPVKFLIGQSHVPFLDAFKKQFQYNDELQIGIGGETVITDADIVDKMLKYVYEDILERMSGIDKKDIRKFIITYPNTFVPRQLDKIRNLMGEILPAATIVFVPESDAVVAYYLTKRFKQEEGFRKAVEEGEEKILIYDMGAGTLDLSYVVIRYDERTNVFSAHIERRLGAPLGGNYLDALIFEKLKGGIVDSASLSKEDLLNMRDGIRDEIKVATDTSKKLSDIITNKEAKWGSSTSETIQSLYDQIEEDYTELCTRTALRNLFGIDRTDPNLKDELNSHIDTFVFSGRGAQFKPLQDRIKELFGEEKIDRVSISKEEMKESVSLGAIEYCRIFDNPADYNFAILNKNQYLNIGLVYKVLNEYNGFELKYTELINPFLKDWSSIEPENGTRYAEFDILVSDLNLRGVDILRFVQTPLDKQAVSDIIAHSSENDNCFINEMFTLKLPRMSNPRQTKISGKMDKNNQLTLVFNDIPFREQTGVEDIERNCFYYKSAWPFNQFNKKN